MRATVNFREDIPIVLAVVALLLGLAQAFHLILTRVQPMLWFAVALLLALRWVLRKQARKRMSLAEKVPEHPLGIGDDSKD
ncbi:MAG TPA: hypothetical protein VMB85_19040 [Bryobacteraceae bacterium]|nr:hypothetical protein [Bryobacteraceae bacterium]